MPEGVNDTVIVLVPKNKEAKELKDYRPISLCNVIYKVVSKCLVNRLRPTLNEIIAPTQSAFIPGRMITDNAIIAFECLHAIQHCNDRRGEFCAYKLDLAKAYDRVDWTYIEKAVEKLGFEREMDFMGNGMYKNRQIFSTPQWSSPRLYHPFSRPETGRSFVPYPF